MADRFDSAFVLPNSILLRCYWQAEELNGVIIWVKNDTSPGIDGSSSSLIKAVYPAIINILLYIVNLSFNMQSFLLD